MTVKLEAKFMNMHNQIENFDSKLEFYLEHQDIPQDISDYYSSWKNLLQCMDHMALRVNNYDFSTVHEEEKRRSEFFALYKQEINKVHIKNLLDDSKNIVKKTSEYLQQRIENEVLQLTIKKEVISNTFKNLTKKNTLQACHICRE
jgi:SOS response regulatory protein OraA/RecX